MDLTRIRSEIPAVQSCIYLNVAGLAPSPEPVLAATIDWLRWQNDLGPAHPDASRGWMELFARTRSTVAAHLGCDAEEIALGHNATDGINVAAWGIDWQPGDEVILSNHEHPGNRITWYNLRERRGIVLRFLDADAGPGLLPALEALLTERTRLVSVSHVSRRSGVVLPIPEIAAACHRRGIRLAVDGAQALGAIPVDVRALGCDYYTWSGHKWLLGPRGTGGLYVRKAVLAETLPSWVGSHSEAYWRADGEFAFLPNAARFEFGTQTHAVYAGLIAAFAWFDALGWEAVYRRVRSRGAGLAQRLAAVPGVSLLPRPADTPSGIVGCRVPPGVAARSVVQRLFQEHGVLTSPLDNDERAIRWAPHFFTTDDELDRAADALATVLHGV